MRDSTFTASFGSLLERRQTMTDKICVICGRPDYSPFRVFDAKGFVINGCVDAVHTGRLVTASESARWHNRPAAKLVRKALDMQRHGKGAAAMHLLGERRVWAG